MEDYADLIGREEKVPLNKELIAFRKGIDENEVTKNIMDMIQSTTIPKESIPRTTGHAPS